MGYFNTLYGSPPSEPRNEERWIIDRQESKRRQNRNSRIRKCKRAQERATQRAAEKAAEEADTTDCGAKEWKRLAEGTLILETLTIPMSNFAQG